MCEKILVTGGSGFIGTNLIEKFAAKGYNIKNIDFKEPINKKHKKFWENIDITNLSEFKFSVDSFNPDYIIHLASRTDLDGLSLNDYQTNITGVENLMKITQDLSSLKKILITSSMLVCPADYNPKDQFDYRPTTIYGESKVLTENKVWSNPPKCDWSIIRPTSIWGPWFGRPYKTFFQLILDKKYFHIGNRSCTKTYGYVGNTVYQIEKILFSNTLDKNNKVFYLGDYESINIEDWANQIAKKLGYTIRKMPYFSIKLAAFFGDFLKYFKVNFPMNTFRLKNMTTNNIVNLSSTKLIAPNLPFDRTYGIKETLEYINSDK